MNALIRSGGYTAIIMALCYISMFVYYGAILNAPAAPTLIEKFAFIAANQVPLAVMNIIGYIVFGVALAITVQAVHQVLKPSSPALSQSASVFGYIWVGIIIAAGMIANVGMYSALELVQSDVNAANTLWVSVKTIEEALGGGIEIVGALWVLLLSWCALKHSILSKPLHYFGLLIGLFGVLTFYPLDLFKELFGLGQIIWFMWLGVSLIKRANNSL